MPDIILPLKIFSLLVHLACFGVAGYRVLGDNQIGRLVLLLFSVLVLFAFEHFQGLGALTLWPVTTIICLGLLRASGVVLSRRFWLGELPFLSGFFLALAWRLTFPDITGNSEAFADLYFINNYLSGATLPPPDYWFAGQHFNFYYGFLHYCAAFMGRLFSLDPGLTYNIAWCVYLGFVVSIVWSFALRMGLAGWARSLIVAVVVAGGNGITPLLPLLVDYDNPNTAVNERLTENAARSNLWATIRWVGGMERTANTAFAASIQNIDIAQGASRKDIRRSISADRKGGVLLGLPMLAFYIYLGDFHPPLASFLLLLLTLAMLVSLERGLPQVQAKWLSGLVIATVPLALISNGWAAPPQALLVGSWLVMGIMLKRRLHWRAMITGGFVSLCLILPFLLTSSYETSLTLKRISPDTANPLQVLMYFWPVLLLFMLALFNRPMRAMTWMIAIVSLVIFIFPSLFNLEQPNSGANARFNTTFKFWEWFHTLAITYFLAAAMSASNRYGKYFAGSIGLALLLFVADVALVAAVSDKPSSFHIEGHRWFTRQLDDEALLKELSNAADGLVLERNLGPVYNPTSRFALFAGKPALLGWPGHIRQWRNHPPAVEALLGYSDKLYRGELEDKDAQSWLDRQRVQYIIWSTKESELGKEIFDGLNALLHDDYQWHAVNSDTRSPVGMWVRRTAFRFPQTS